MLSAFQRTTFPSRQEIPLHNRRLPPCPIVPLPSVLCLTTYITPAKIIRVPVHAVGYPVERCFLSEPPRRQILSQGMKLAALTAPAFLIVIGAVTVNHLPADLLSEVLLKLPILPELPLMLLRGLFTDLIQ